MQISYQIVIDEAQRMAIVEALANFPPSVTEEEAENDIVAYGVYKLLELLKQLPDDVKQDQEKFPGKTMTYGLCI
jgi:hypothetical protein